MSSKKFVYLLMVLIVCGSITGGITHGQSTDSFRIEGTVTNPDGTPAAGLQIQADIVPFTYDHDFTSFVSRDDGTYGLSFLGFEGPSKISAGDRIRITATDAEGNDVARTTYTVTPVNVDMPVNKVTIPLTVGPAIDVTVTVNPSDFMAGTSDPGTVTVTVMEEDVPVRGETVTLSLSPAVGMVTSPATNNDDGTYSATYTSGNTAGRVTLKATATQAGVSNTATIAINAGPPATIAVSAAPERVPSFGSAVITAMVADSNGNGVDGLTPTGTRSSGGTLTNFAPTTTFGSYTAIYTAPMVDAEGTETVTVMVDGISGQVSLTLTPVPPVAVSILDIMGTVSKADDVTPADGVTVTVTVGSRSDTGTTETDGSFSATFVNPFGTVASTGDLVSIVVTDDTGAKRGGEDFHLTNDLLGEGGTAIITQLKVPQLKVGTDIVVPPRSVNVLVVEGVVISDDDVSPVEDVDFTVTVTIESSLTKEVTEVSVDLGEDGTYTATAVNLFTSVASTGDLVSTVVVTDADGVERGREVLELTNVHLSEDGTGMATLDVPTDITLPPKSVGILVVEGIVVRDDETTPVGQGFDAKVTVGSMSQMGKTDANGAFSVTFFNLGATVATTGDMVSTVVSDNRGDRGSSEKRTLTNADLEVDPATITQKVITDVGATSNVLAVMGTVYLKNGDTQSVPAVSRLREDDLTVVVTNTTRNLTESGPVDSDGEYSVTFLSFSGTVAETGDSLTVEVQNEAGGKVGMRSRPLTTAEVAAAKAEVDVETTVPAAVRALDITGSVIEIGGSPAGSGLEVTLTLAMNGHTMPPAQTLTDAGGYNYTFVRLLTPVAVTGDVLMVDVLRAADQYHGHAVVPLRSYELVDGQLTVDPIELIPPKLELGGLSINTHYTGIQDPVIQQLLSMDLAGLAAAGANAVDPPSDLLVMLPPSLPLLISPILAAIGLLQLELPPGFEPTDENIAQENFGNAITTRPTAWAALPADQRHPGRWVNGDQLNLYISGAPTIESVTFMLNGTPLNGTPISVPAGGTFMYNFQLEEEWIALFSGAMETFRAVQLMIDGHPQSPFNMTRNDMGVWSADVPLSPGDHVSYYYMIELFEPYVDPMGGIAITKFPLIDPRNRQLKTSGLSQAIEGLLTSELGALDSGLRSVFSVPEVNAQQSLWVGKLLLDTDDEYTLEVDVGYRGGYQEPEPITAMFTVDQTPPAADVALNLDAPGMNAGMYSPADRYYVATGPMPGEASLTVSATPGATSEAAGYMYQLARLDVAGNPGTWNPVVAADLLPLTLEKLLTDPASVLPMTFVPPHQVDMLIRNSQGGALLGTYGLRAVGIDSLLNMDSSGGPSVIVELVPPDPDIAVVSFVQADFDGNGVIEGLEMQSTAGDVVVFSDSMVTLTVDVVERTRHPLTSIALEFQIPGGNWQPIGMFTGDQLTKMGDQFMVPLPVPDIPVLPDRGGHVMVRTVTTNALNVVNEQVFSAAYQRRTAPEVSGIYTSITDRHPDSGGPQGMITISAFTQAMTAPNAAAVQLEVRRSADADWRPLGSVPIADSTVTSHVEIAIIEDLVNSILSGSPTAPISPLYRKWSLPVDSAVLEDTILDDTPAASDASLDDNPYVVRAVAIDMAGTAYPSADGITDRISLDNYSPTAITTVANEVEMVVPREDGSYYVSGLIHESVPDPVLTLTSRTGAHPSAFTGGIALAVNDASGTAMEIPATGFIDSGNYTFKGVFNLSSIPNGTYTFMAAAHAADGSPEARIVAMAITVEVGNFTPPDNFADPSVDILSVTNTRGEANSPSEIDAMYPTGFPAIDDKVTPTLIVPNVSTGDLDVLIGDDGMSAAMMGALMVMEPDANNNIVIMIDTSGLDEGMYGLVGTVTKPNGSVPFGLPSIQVDRTGPAIEIVSPLSRHQVTTLPTIQVAFTDTTGFDVTETPMPVVISLTRLVDDVAIDVTETLIRITAAADGEVLTRSGDIVYTHDAPPVGGAYRIEVTATDVLGNEGVAEPVEFTVEGVQLTVSIITPIAGQVVDPTQPLIITAALTGNGEIEVTEFQFNSTDEEGRETVTNKKGEETVENNWLTYTVQPPLDGFYKLEDDVWKRIGGPFQRGASNTVTIKISDSEGRTAEATSNFVVALDKTPPVVATYSPQGIIRSNRPVVAATVTDESGIDTSSLEIFIAGVKGNQGEGRLSGTSRLLSPTSTTVTFTPSVSVTPGPYTARVTVLDVHGNRTEVEWQFTVELDVTPPSIATTSPHGIIRSDKPIVSVSASDDRSGVDTIDIVVKGGRGRAVEGIASTRSDRTAATFTPIVSLENGTYTVDTIVTDKRGNKAKAKWQFTVELDVTPPSITTTSPHGTIRLDRPTVSVSASDDHSGVNTIEVMVADKANQLINGITEVHADKTSANFTPSAPLKDGTYTVDVNVTDMRGNQASSKWQFTVELDTIPPSVTITRPAQGHTENRRPTISATYTDDLSGVDGQSIKLWLDDDPVDPDEVSITQVMFTPSSDLEFGQHTVKLEVSDTAPTPNMAVQEWSFFVERIGIANARNYPNPFEDDTTIGFRLSRKASVTVRIYDFTGRLVAEPVTNSLEEAGPVEIAWNGDTSAGENLARGVYFCHILMESELEPQSAILKMAIISE